MRKQFMEELVDVLIMVVLIVLFFGAYMALMVHVPVGR